MLPPLPADLVAADAPAWLGTFAARLLTAHRLRVAGRPHRLIEVEAYLHSATHPDPFAHRHPVQLTAGRWYFHRTGGSYRGGSFKGLDLTFGNGAAFGGFLLRGLETPDGRIIDGPSLLVDHLLRETGCRTVAELDRAAESADSPLSLVAVEPEVREVWRSLRVGLSLKKKVFAPNDVSVTYLRQPYRYLTDPRRTKKGKPHAVLPLLTMGIRHEEITAITGCPLAAVKRYAEAYDAGKTERSVEGYYGRELSTTDLCRLYGRFA